MTETMPKTVSKISSKTDRPDDLFDDDQSKIERLYGLWNIVLNRDYPLFAEMIRSSHKLSDNLDTRKQLEAERRKFWSKTGSSHAIRHDSCQIDTIFDRICYNSGVYDPADTAVWVKGSESSWKHYITSVQILVDMCDRIEVLKTEYKNHSDNFKALTLRVAEIIKIHAKTYTDDSEDSMSIFTKYMAILLLAYNGSGNEKLIEQTLHYTCSIYFELARSVVKVHGNLIHVLENGEQCTRCCV
jgi:hypothetical protein